MSKTRVNLYLPSMRPVKEKLPLSLMVVCWVGALFLVGVGSLYVYFEQSKLNELLSQSSLELNASKTELTQLQARHADYKPSPQLMTQLDRLTQELNGKRFLSQHLKGNVGPDQQRYSQVMVDMGRYHDARLWLTKMRFDEQGVFLKGFATEATAVPQWLNQLQDSQFFSGKSFALMNLKDKSNQVIAFEINTVVQDDLSSEEKLEAIKAMSDIKTGGGR